MIHTASMWSRVESCHVKATANAQARSLIASNFHQIIHQPIDLFNPIFPAQTSLFSLFTAARCFCALNGAKPIKKTYLIEMPNGRESSRVESSRGESTWEREMWSKIKKKCEIFVDLYAGAIVIEIALDNV